MSYREMARTCARDIAEALGIDETISEVAFETVVDRIHESLSMTGPCGEVSLTEVRQTSLGAIDVKVTKSTQGVSLEVDVKRPREPGESYDDASLRSATLAAWAYKRAADELAEITGLSPGKEPKA